MARSPFPELNLRILEENIALPKSGAPVAWYSVPHRRSSFPLAGEFDQLIADGGRRAAELVGRTVYVRRTSRPYQVEQWARDVARDLAPDDVSLPPGTVGQPLPGWQDGLARVQVHLMDRTLDEPEAYYGVELGSRPGSAKLLGNLGWHRTLEIGGLDKERHEVDRIMAGPGLGARPATMREVKWLVHRSACLGMPAPITLPSIEGRWADGDLGSLTDNVRWSCGAYDRTVKVRAVVDGVEHVRHVAILVVGQTMDDLDIPGDCEPWMQRSDRLGFPVEWFGCAEILPRDTTKARMRSVTDKIRNQVEHWVDEHKRRPPSDLSRQDARAGQVEDELKHGAGSLALRADVWARCAVAGDTEEEALDLARTLAREYDPYMELVSGYDQYARARSFIPCEPLGDLAYRRSFPVATWAAAMPQATAKVGDRKGGFYRGTTCGTSEVAVFWHLWRSMEEDERSGATVLAGGLGSGKSITLGAVTYDAVRYAGAKATLFDPSERLQALCTLPELRDVSRFVPLLRAEPGTLNPYRVVAEPRREHYRYDDDGNRRSDDDARHYWELAKRQAGAQRRSLCLNNLTQVIVPQVADLPAARLLLMDAVRRVGGSYTRSPVDVIGQLVDVHGTDRELALQLARLLRDASEMPQGALIFPSGYHLDYDHDRTATALLTVYGMKGVQAAPEGTDRRDWSQDELYSGPLMGNAAWLTQRSLYEEDPDQRKLVGWDEAHAMEGSSSGRTLVVKTLRDTRKHNTRAIFCSQNITDLDLRLRNYLDNVLVGRTEAPDAQRAAVQALGLPVGVGYEAELGALSPHAAGSGEAEVNRKRGPREFLFNDGVGGLEKVRMDLGATPELLKALDTTADHKRARRRATAAAQ